MRREGINYLAVGAFVIAMVVALIVWIALLSGRTGPSDDYFVVYRNVMGLKTGVEILYEGYPVGRIEKIERIERDGRPRYRVDVTVKRGWPIPEDSVAEISAPGLLASVVIDIHAGDSAQLLKPGAEIPGGEPTDLVSAVNEVTSRVVSLIDKTIEPALMDISRGTPQIVENLQKFTDELNDSVSQINALLTPHNVERVSKILANVETASENANSVLADLGETRRRVDQLIERTDQLLREDDGEVGSALTNLNHSLAAVARHIDAISANLETTSRNMNEFSRQIRENPSALVRGREAPPDGN
jgi:phospholipid/cholesterol/gamma-HCH transport system substrate-binding protein